MTNQASKFCLSPLQAAALIDGGQLVAFPTETVYGLGADATSESAAKQIFKLKGRPANNPLIVHTNCIERIREIAVLPDPNTDPGITARLNKLTALWPGPLTIILPKAPQITATVTNGAAAVGVRIPAHPMALEFLAACRNPVAAPSANRSNRISPTSAQHVEDEFNSQIQILDGGPCDLGIESTVVEPLENGTIIHRPGYITAEQIEALAGPLISRANVKGPGGAEETMTSPGQLSLHYAPNTPCYFLTDIPAELRTRALAIIGTADDIARSRELVPPNSKIVAFHSLTAFASGLYRELREADKMGFPAIAVIPPPPYGLGLAIRDRLSRSIHR